MSGTRAAATLARLDDEALEVLASAGLLRRARKDLARSQPQVLEDGSVLRAEVDGHEVVVGVAGPAAATCSCPAAGTCQHVLVLALHARTVTAGESSARPGAPSSGGTGRAPTAAPDPLGHLAAVPVEDLLAHAGRPGYRWAHDAVVDLDLAADVRVRSDPDGSVTVSLLRPRATLRWLGGPWQEAVVSPAGGQAARSRVAALLAVRRATGADVPPPPAPVAHRGGPEDDAAGRGEVEARERARSAAGDLLLDCVALGLAHVDDDVRERAETLAVWTQTAGYHRLSRVLRAVADQVGSQLRRHAAADSARLLDTLATGHALVAALVVAEQAARDGGPDVPVTLTGRARGRFVEVDRLDVLGVGGVPWRSATGFVGLTTYWWSPARRQVLSCTDARPETLRGFDPRERWTQPGPWTGLVSPAAGAGRLLRLTGARLSDDGRLSAVESTVAAALPAPADLAALALEPCERWADLRAGSPRATLLADPAAEQQVVLVRPADAGAPAFDPARQVLVWPLADADGDVLGAEVAWGPYGAAAVRHLEAVGASLATGTLVWARVRSRAGTAVLEPVSTWPGPGGDVESVHLPTSGSPSRPSGRSGPSGDAPGPTPRARGADGADGAEPDGAEPDAPAVPAALAALRGWSVATAERGTSPAATARAWQEVARLRRRAADAGWTALPDPTRTPVGDARAAAAAVLRTHAVLLQHERLLGRAAGL
ncbi:hypothetical protein [Aquipuribacter sp. SD81]|uniref:hypothetical protein n=1 Tax=Aquipuribacter sp. SD81 TaxID=3127703 RepID=UPI00301AF5E8